MEDQENQNSQMGEMNNQGSQQQSTINRQQSGGNNSGGIDVDASNEKLLAVLGYFSILFILPLFMAKNNEFAQFHGKQGAVLFVAEVITGMIIIIPVLGLWIAYVAWIVWLILAITGISNVFKGLMKPLPIIGGFAKKF